MSNIKYVCLQHKNGKDYLIHHSWDFEEFKSFFRGKKEYYDSSYEFREIPKDEWNEFLEECPVATEFFIEEVK